MQPQLFHYKEHQVHAVWYLPYSKQTKTIFLLLNDMHQLRHKGINQIFQLDMKTSRKPLRSSV
ncbi:hypothetical protein A9Q98_07225 [Thalassotalea sp. 42_200_T64]|nr:hypothetical protein A9Q98_07225 [Thalassotalea sp. 42_200_T64]